MDDHSESATAGRGLESAIGVGAGIVLAIRSVVIVVRVVMICRLDSLKRVMYPVRCRVGDEKYQGHRPKSA